MDHAAAHDLIGCQDIAWDLVGAEVEFCLSGAEADAVRRAVEDTAGRVEAALIGLMRPCYLAFQLGAYTLAADWHWRSPEEQARLGAQAAFYRARLERLLREVAP